MVDLPHPDLPTNAFLAFSVRVKLTFLRISLLGSLGYEKVTFLNSIMPLYYLRNLVIKMKDIYFTVILFGLFIPIKIGSITPSKKTLYASVDG